LTIIADWPLPLYPSMLGRTMTEYVVALCCMSGAELVPVESLNITAVDDAEAVQKAVEWRKASEWRVSTINAAPIDRKAWLQVLHDGKAIFSQKIGRF
jgi:hypothetical protein